MKFKKILSLGIILLGISLTATAQFEEPEIVKISNEDRESFMSRFSDIGWTGQGLYQETAIDQLETSDIRARLQAVFGAPTVTIADLVNKKNFRLGHAIQFEYRFVINGTIPMMVLDYDGPFGRGLTYVGASRYIDLMPQIKRTFARKLMEVEQLGEFRDYFYSPEREQWFDVRYENGEFTIKKIDAPKGMSIN